MTGHNRDHRDKYLESSDTNLKMNVINIFKQLENKMEMSSETWNL